MTDIETAIQIEKVKAVLETAKSIALEATILLTGLETGTVKTETVRHVVNNDVRLSVLELTAHVERIASH